MAVEATADCTVIDAFIPPLCIPLPGGAEICFQTPPGSIPTSADVCAGLLPQLNVALGALAPVFCLIDVALAVVDLGKAIPDSLGPPPDPTAVIKAVTNLVEKAACLLPLIPQLSICPMIKAFLDLIISCLTNIKEQLETLFTLNLEVANAESVIDELNQVASIYGLDLNLASDYLSCALSNLGLQQDALDGSLSSIRRLLDITVNPILGIIGLGPIEIEDLNLSAGAPEELIAPLEAIIDVLKVFRDSLPC